MIRTRFAESLVRKFAKRAVVKCFGQNHAIFSIIRKLDSALMGYELSIALPVPPPPEEKKEEYPTLVLKRVTLETTSRCNLRCVHCIFSKENNLGNYPYEDLPFELFKKVLPVFSKDKPIVELYGHGETLTHKQFFDMMDALLDAGCSVEFLTNGQLLDDEKIEKIVSRGVSKVGFSIDGATPEMYEKIRRGASFEKLINNIRKIDEFKKRLGKNTPLISIGFVAMRQNIHELPELIRLAHSLGAFLVHVMELAEYNLTRGESLANQQVLADWVEKAEIEAKRLNIQLALPTHIPGRDAPPANLTTPQNSAPHKIIKSCRMPWEYVFIRTSGAIQPCCFIPDIYGQLKDEEFTEIWHGSKFLQLRDGLLEGAPPEPCTRCPYYV